MLSELRDCIVVADVDAIGCSSILDMTVGGGVDEMDSKYSNESGRVSGHAILIPLIRCLP